MAGMCANPLTGDGMKTFGYTDRSHPTPVRA